MVNNKKQKSKEHLDLEYKIRHILKDYTLKPEDKNFQIHLLVKD
jgi:hypothetical protein